LTLLGVGAGLQIFERIKGPLEVRAQDPLAAVLDRSDHPADHEVPNRRLPVEPPGRLRFGDLLHSSRREATQVEGERLPLALPAGLDVERGDEKLADVVGRAAAARELPVRGAGPIAQQQAGVAERGVAVQPPPAPCRKSRTPPAQGGQSQARSRENLGLFQNRACIRARSRALRTCAS